MSPHSRRPRLAAIVDEPQNATTAQHVDTRPADAAEEGVKTNIMALVENSQREIGLAFIDIVGLPTISVCQISSNKMYTKARSVINRFQPRAVVFCSGPGQSHGCKGESLVSLLRRLEDGPVQFEPLGRKYFNEAQGLVLLKQLSLIDEVATLGKELAPLYLALAALHALVEHCRWKLGLLMQSTNAVRIELLQVDGFMLVDGSTLASLEVLRNARTGDDKQCLYGVLNRCRTKGGQKLLRASLCMPPSDLPTIRARQSCVRDFLSSQQLFEGTAEALKHVGDVDKILRPLAGSNSTSSGAQSASALNKVHGRIRSLLQLRDLLKVCTELRDVLRRENVSGGMAEIRHMCAEQLCDPALDCLAALVSNVLDTSNGTALNQPHALVNAVVAGMSGTLDHCRSVWLQGYADLHELVSHYNNEGSVQMVLTYSTRRGFHMNTQGTSEHDQNALAELGFTQVARASKRILACTTQEMTQLNVRMRKTFEEIVLASGAVLEEVWGRVRDNMRALYLLSEAIALIDVMLSLAELAMACDGEYTCPEMTSHGPLVIRNGRHPLLELLNVVDETTPNSTYLSEESNFIVITGPNMSGKSTLLQQTMLLVLLAHMGSMVPAAFASIPVFGRLLSRLSTNDCLESNSSSFTVEMVDVACMMHTISSDVAQRSLAVVDELGRGTCNREGLAIAWAVAERLASHRNVYTMFATHFLQLQGLAKLYPNVRCSTMSVVQDVENRRFAMLHRVSEGTTAEGDYLTGMLAELAGIPSFVITEARQIRETLAADVIASVQVTVEQGDAHCLAERCRNLRHSTLDHAALCGLLRELQAEALRLVEKNAAPCS